MIALYATSVLGLIAALVLVIWYMEKEIRTQRREFMRTVNGLTDRIMHLSGQTWTPPPSVEKIEPLELNYDMFPDADDN